jgi:riboflavin synthase
MFTGIIETIGQVKEISINGENKSFWIESQVFSELRLDQSISHDGVCLTVEELKDGLHKVTAVKETLGKTNLNHWQVNSQINLERSLQLSDRLDGHLVQGHADTTAILIKQKDQDGSWTLTFSFPKKYKELIVEKGSISINGVSLTVFDLRKNSFKVAIIPYTWQHTNLQYIKLMESANLEFDLIGKYIMSKVNDRKRK